MSSSQAPRARAPGRGGAGWGRDGAQRRGSWQRPGVLVSTREAPGAALTPTSSSAVLAPGSHFPIGPGRLQVTYQDLNAASDAQP